MLCIYTNSPRGIKTLYTANMCNKIRKIKKEGYNEELNDKMKEWMKKLRNKILYWSSLCYCNAILEASNFIMTKGLLSLYFRGFEGPRWAVPIVQLLSSGWQWWKHVRENDQISNMNKEKTGSHSPLWRKKVSLGRNP